MQSLNIAYFQPVKHYYREAIDEAVRLNAIKFLLIEFVGIWIGGYDLNQ
jgi:hypothetical protein